MLLLDFIELANKQGYDVYTSGKAGITLKGSNKQLYFDSINECAQWLNNL